MPYIQIKAYPKDAEIKKKVVEEINEVFLKYWGCPKEAISISIEEIVPEKWEETVVEKDIKENLSKMMILSGNKKF